MAQRRRLWRRRPLSIDFGIWEFTWRSLVLRRSALLVIPAPWVIVWYLEMACALRAVSGTAESRLRPASAMTIVPWYFGAIVVVIVASH